MTDDTDDVDFHKELAHLKAELKRLIPIAEKGDERALDKIGYVKDHASGYASQCEDADDYTDEYDLAEEFENLSREAEETYERLLTTVESSDKDEDEDEDEDDDGWDGDAQDWPFPLQPIKGPPVPLLDNEFDARIKEIGPDYVSSFDDPNVIKALTDGPQALAGASDEERQNAARKLKGFAEYLNDKEDEYYLSRLGDRILGYSDADEGQG